MTLSSQQANAITSGAWLVGIGTLIVTGWWWPGIMFLIGITAIIRGFVDGWGWSSWQAGLWSIGIGAWALSSYNLLVLFVLIALSGLAQAFFTPIGSSQKPEPGRDLDDGF